MNQLVSFSLRAVVVCSLIDSTAFGMQIFENALRRGPVEQEEKGIVKMNITLDDGRKTYCTAFFVKNEGGLPLIATARHCVGYEIKKACASKLFEFTIEYGDFKDWRKASGEVETYSLSSQRPRSGSRLKMMGYPSDSSRNRAFTVTDNCWVSDQPLVRVADDPLAEQAKIAAAMAPSREIRWRT